VVKELIIRYANMNLKDNSGWTSFDLCIFLDYFFNYKKFNFFLKLQKMTILKWLKSYLIIMKKLMLKIITEELTQPPTSERSLTNVTSFESHLPVGLHELTNLQQHTTSETTKSENDLKITTEQQQQSSLKRSATSYIIDEVKK
jgi:hypothetical protein